MLISFQLANYRSFAEPARLDWTVGAQAPDDYRFLMADGQRVVKLLGLFGANASGKTNLLRALTLLAEFATDSFQAPPAAPLPFEPHFFQAEKPIGLELEFLLPESGQRYRYALQLTRERVLHESLKIKSSRFFSRVFEREWRDGAYKVVGLGERHQANLRQNVSWLSWLAQYNLVESQALLTYFRRLRGNVKSMGRVPHFIHVFPAIETYRTQPQFKAQFIQHLANWDLAIDDVVFERLEGLPAEIAPYMPWMAFCIHRRGERSARVPIFDESSGTLGLFSLLSVVLPVLAAGGVAVVDELEADLHPHMLAAVLDLFIRPETNPKAAQLLFATHADWLMDSLHKSQIGLVERQGDQSQVFRLSDVKGVLPRENHAARYRAGAYGGVPELHS